MEGKGVDLHWDLRIALGIQTIGRITPKEK